ncbi:MAG: hypothetical protein Ct9H300mP22_6200 [Gammaproteobacteria bacterium]|nr:MAG: hypothetical protein Ct9H300mP22_6200 [Gammaproteobacteria bacterium]
MSDCDTCILGLNANSEPLLVTLFQNENFPRFRCDWFGWLIRAYSLGLIAFMAFKIFSPGFYARQNTSTPVRIGIIPMTSNMVMNIIFYLTGLAHVGLAWLLVWQHFLMLDCYCEDYAVIKFFISNPVGPSFFFECFLQTQQWFYF